MAQKDEKEKTRADIMHEIEEKHLGRCFEQLWGYGRRTLFELMEVRGTGKQVVVVKQFESRVPASGSRKPWPDLIAAQVYAVIDEGNMTWTGLDEALEKYRKAHEGC